MGIIRAIGRAMGAGMSALRESDRIKVNPQVIPTGIWPDADTAVDALTASSIACVKRCIDVKAGAVASLGLHLYRKKNNGKHAWFEDYDGSPLDRILSEQPNYRQNAYDFLWDIVYNREMYGDAYIVPRYSAGMLTELISIPGQCMTSYDHNQGIYHVSDSYDGIYGDYRNAEILHIKGYTRDGFVGAGVPELARLILSIAMKTYKQQSEMFTPGSTLRGFITGDDGGQIGFGGSSDDQLSSVTNRIRKELKEGNNLGYLPGTMKFVPTSMTPADMQLLESMKFINIEICRMIGVPPTQVFQDSNVNYKSSESSQTILMTSTVVPLTKQIESEFNCKLLTPTQRMHMKVRFNLDDYYQTDPSVQAIALSNLVKGAIYTSNDARERLGMSPVKGGDTVTMQGAAKTGAESTTQNKTDDNQPSPQPTDTQSTDSHPKEQPQDKVNKRSRK